MTANEGLIIRLAKLLNISPDSVFQLASKAPYKYRSYQIPKKNGGKRLIAQPTSEIKKIQRVIFENELSWMPIHDSATAYRKNIGIVKNANPHINGLVILKMDFSDFFNRIIPDDFLKCILKNQELFGGRKYSTLDLRTLINFIFWRPKSEGLQLSIGAPSSPFISNALMYDFDDVIFNQANKLGCKYTRYSDDITISGDCAENLRLLKKIVRDTVLHGGIAPKLALINEKKTKIFSAKSDKSVTGVQIKNGKLTTGKSHKKIVRIALHKLKYNQKLDAEFHNKVRGVFLYVKSIDDQYELEMATRYTSEVVNKLLTKPV